MGSYVWGELEANKGVCESKRVRERNCFLSSSSSLASLYSPFLLQEQDEQNYVVFLSVLCVCA